MSERRSPHEDRDPCWQKDLAIGEGRFYRGETYTIRMRLHTERKRCHRHQELLPLSEERGERVDVHGRPYILVPDITFTLGLYPRPDPHGAVGEVVSSTWEGMRHEDIGQAQAWWYPAKRLVMLWECFPEHRFRTDDPRTDPTLAVLWTGFERVLRDRFPDATRIATTWEPIYDRQPGRRS